MKKRCHACHQTGEHAEWCPGRHGLRSGRRVAASQVRVTPIPVHEDHPGRTWRPEEKATDEAMNAVLEILLRRGRSYQHDIADELAAVLDIPLGTARANTSASLLFFREAGWVRLVETEGRRAVWELDG